MASDNGVKFVWKIENISCITDGTIASPIFDLDCNYFKWKVIISPEEPFIKVQRIGTLYYNFWGYSIAILNSKGLPLFWREKINPPNPEFIKFSYMEKSVFFGSERDKFLPNDVLILQCIIWNTKEEIYNPRTLFTSTRIEPKAEVIKKTFTWNITNAIQRLKENDYINHIESLTNNRELCIKMKEFVLILTKNFTNVNTNLNCIVSLLDTQKEIIQFAQKEGYLTEITDNLKIHLPISEAMLKHYRNQFLPQDTLSLVFECTFTFRPKEFKVTFNNIVKECDIFSNNSQPTVPTTLPATDSEASLVEKADDTISEALRVILKEGFMSDFTFRVQDRTFPVHKLILGSRSSVFRAMFTTAMKEKEDNAVDIPDMDADTFQRLLDFVYSDTIQETMTSDSASSLFSAADKYALETLKQRCSALLIAGLSTSDVLDVLVLGDIHQDEGLKEAALDFMAKNDKDVVGNEDWVRFEEEYPKLGMETLRKLYLKKIKE